MSLCDDSTVLVNCLTVDRLGVNITWKAQLEDIPAASLPDLHDIGMDFACFLLWCFFVHSLFCRIAICCLLLGDIHELDNYQKCQQLQEWGGGEGGQGEFLKHFIFFLHQSWILESLEMSYEKDQYVSTFGLVSTLWKGARIYNKTLYPRRTGSWLWELLFVQGADSSQLLISTGHVPHSGDRCATNYLIWLSASLYFLPSYLSSVLSNSILILPSSL